MAWSLFFCEDAHFWPASKRDLFLVLTEYEDLGACWNTMMALKQSNCLISFIILQSERNGGTELVQIFIVYVGW